MQVSLITCTLNSERTIKDCCLCISAQSLKTLEHIIIDNRSKDQTIQIAKQFKINKVGPNNKTASKRNPAIVIFI